MSGRRWALLASVVGAALAIVVVARVGFSDVAQALARIGWRGLLALIVWSALPYALLGFAWFILLPARPWTDLARLIGARVVRDSAGELLPFTAVGGFAAGARAAVLAGIEATAAMAATVVDVTMELIAQLGFTALGIILLVRRLDVALGRRATLEAALAGLGLSAAGVAGFLLLQRRGLGPIARLIGRFTPAIGRRLESVGETLASLYEPPGRLAAAAAAHFAAWVASAVGVWLALSLGGERAGVWAIVALEALVYATRSVAFVAPMGAGVQEATYALLGPIFGLSPELAVAISLIKRARDIAIGLPALSLWQAAEGRRLARR